MQRYQIEFDVHYGYWYNTLCESFYRRVDFGCNLVQLTGGSVAAAGVIASYPWLVGFSGIALALCAAFSLAMQPAVKAERHCQIKSSWLDLQASMPMLSDAELLAKVAEKKKSDLGMLSMNLPASNAAMRSLGYTDGFAHLSAWQRFVQRLAM
ncbi:MULTISPECIES: hypothetical protein [Comamonas]|uniref:hypothetical protein n=1 Tax=Comamonas TaxID=283 RepID=UPI00237E2BF9|nr:hypothetical protein [Comamonas aquatica]MDE1555367.1 hypothetical protein [Comamonas aquatica]